ncbi:hypothetical protein [Paenibacillus sp. PvR148]
MKKMLVLALGLMMLFTLVACGGNNTRQEQQSGTPIEGAQRLTHQRRGVVGGNAENAKSSGGVRKGVDGLNPWMRVLFMLLIHLAVRRRDQRMAPVSYGLSCLGQNQWARIHEFL